MRERVVITKPAVREFEYRPNKLVTILLFFLVCGGEAMFVYYSFGREEGEMVNGIEELARLIFRTVACIGPISILGMGWSVVFSFTSRLRIALTTDSLIAPRGGWRRWSDEIEIPFASIRSAHANSVGPGTMVLVILHDTGKFTVPSTMFPKRSEFNILVAKLSAALERRDSEKQFWVTDNGKPQDDRQNR